MPASRPAVGTTVPRGCARYSSEAGGRYYAAFLLDPDGNNVEAVRREF